MKSWAIWHAYEQSSSVRISTAPAYAPPSRRSAGRWEAEFLAFGAPADAAAISGSRCESVGYCFSSGGRKRQLMSAPTAARTRKTMSGSTGLTRRSADQPSDGPHQLGGHLVAALRVACSVSDAVTDMVVDQA
jgi:hypothetical protein